jgi:hypothetical protein
MQALKLHNKNQKIKSQGIGLHQKTRNHQGALVLILDTNYLILKIINDGLLQGQ